MTLTIKMDVEEKTGAECSYGNAEIFADDCKNESEKMMAKIISTNVVNTLNVLKDLAENLFTPPKKDGEK